MRSIALLLVMAGTFLALRWFLRQPYGIRVGAGLSAIGLGLVLLAAVGRLPMVLGVVGVLLPMLAVVHGLRQRLNDDRRHGQASTGGQSVVTTRFLRMTLDHDTGEMAGQVLAGQFAGAALDTLAQQQLIELLNDLTGEDDDSAALLRAFMDRTYGTDWQEAPSGDGNPEGLSGEMTRGDAYAILGLEEGASREQIIAAHGRLIQRLHPDRGGSTFLAAKINQARDLLLEA